MFLRNEVRSRLEALARAGSIESWLVDLVAEHAGRGLRAAAPNVSPMFARLREEEEHGDREEVRALSAAMRQLSAERPVEALEVHNLLTPGRGYDQALAVCGLQYVQSEVDLAMGD